MGKSTYQIEVDPDVVFKQFNREFAAGTWLLGSEVASAVGVSSTRVYTLAEKDKLRCRTVGPTKFFAVADVVKRWPSTELARAYESGQYAAWVSEHLRR